MIRERDALLERLLINEGKDAISKEIQENATIFLKTNIKFALSAKRVCLREKLNQEMFYEVTIFQIFI